MLENGLTPPTLLEIGIFQHLIHREGISLSGTIYRGTIYIGRLNWGEELAPRKIMEAFIVPPL